MFIYTKILFAMVISVVVIEANAFVQANGLGHFVMAFVDAGFILAGAFFIISKMDKFAHPKQIKHGKKLRNINSGKSKQHFQPHFSGIK